MADIVGDWFFWDYVRGLADDDLSGEKETWEYIVMATAIVSSIIGLINVAMNLFGCQTCSGRATICGLAPTKFSHLLETIVSYHG